MASQEKKEKEGGGEQEKGVTENSGPESVPAWAESRRLGPWHPPDYQRQRALADRLSNPALRSSRPATSPQETPHSSFPSLQHSPYQPSSSSSRAATASNRSNNSRNHHHHHHPSKMNSHRASSGPVSSPRAAASPRRQAHLSSSSSSSASPQYGSVSPRRQPPLFLTPATSRKVTEDELDVIVDRITKPTVSSRGGVDLQDKDFTYIPTPRLKTLPVVPGLDRRYLGLQRVDSARMEEIVLRLTRMTSASKAKFAPNKNVYVDMEPGAHMVSQRSAQSAV